ncbi:hypothetical protein MIND_00965300 [Mycena indigotica]|uniref:Uncharacterized protein n=1 Tax=Mycena indigotica TaxID=2126181 RepID=A0A8H6SD37_9AGAR|nr:uncharacterized protein MIND_00965300 [Mycena indigotica]KAF7297320.1 hypothetical protein MIND_00965300 [Mycena indigotica]
MHTSTLPSGLWDLTMARLATRTHTFRLGRLGSVHSARHYAQPAFAQSSSPSVSQPPLPIHPAEAGIQGRSLRRRRTNAGALTPRTGRPVASALAELEQRIIALKEVADSEVRAAEEPIYSEDALLALYEDLLANSEPSAPLPELQAPKESTRAIVARLEEQLMLPVTTTIASRHSALLERLAERGSPALEAFKIDPGMELHRRVLQLADAKLQLLGVLPSSSTTVAIPLFTTDEYSALTRLCIQEGDVDAAEQTLELMKRSGVPIPEDSLSLILRQYSDIGNATGADYCLANFLTGPPTESQRHLHISAHLRANPRGRIPESALTILHSYETQSHPAPMQTYSSIISALYATNLSLARAQAWDIFSHMRYVAHPVPDAVLYTQMIRACASPIGNSRSSEPERALDLWTEMTVEQKLKPSVGSYNAIILACARSGVKIYVDEAFRIAKQMLDSNRDAFGRSQYLPDRGTIIALLEGAKRIGDLSRTRWILADMVRGDNTNPSEAVNEEVMMHVFQTYAAYIPPFTRYLAQLKVVQGKSTADVTGVPTATKSDSENANVKSDPTARFTHIPPQTGQEVLQEVDALFARLMSDTGKDESEPASSRGKFSHVQWTPRLVSSYLSVHYQHASIGEVDRLFWSTFKAVGVKPDARCYVEAIEACAGGKTPRQHRLDGLRFAERLWEQYHGLEMGRKASGTPIDARLVERAHGGFIRALALNHQLPLALSQLRIFFNRYPPRDLRKPSALQAFRSTRTVLVGPKPLVRLTTPSEVPDDDVPPFLLFDDVELLHHRLVAKIPQPQKEIGWLKYVCKSYEWALRRRRDSALQAELPKPEKNSKAVTQLD